MEHLRPRPLAAITIAPASLPLPTRPAAPATGALWHFCVFLRSSAFCYLLLPASASFGVHLRPAALAPLRLKTRIRLAASRIAKPRLMRPPTPPVWQATGHAPYPQNLWITRRNCPLCTPKHACAKALATLPKNMASIVILYMNQQLTKQATAK